MVRRRPHSRWHDVTVLAIAVIAVLWAGIAVITTKIITEPSPASAPQEVSTLPPLGRAERAGQAAQASRAGERHPLPTPRPARPGSPPQEGEGVTPPSPDEGWLTAVVLCIRTHESGDGQGSYDYQAENPTSSASGAWQFIDSTWVSVTGLPAPASAYDRATQDAAFRKLWANGAGAHHWVTAEGCGA